MRPKCFRPAARKVRGTTLVLGVFEPRLMAAWQASSWVNASGGTGNSGYDSFYQTDEGLGFSIGASCGDGNAGAGGSASGFTGAVLGSATTGGESSASSSAYVETTGDDPGPLISLVFDALLNPGIGASAFGNATITVDGEGGSGEASCGMSDGQPLANGSQVTAGGIMSGDYENFRYYGADARVRQPNSTASASFSTGNEARATVTGVGSAGANESALWATLDTVSGGTAEVTSEFVGFNESYRSQGHVAIDGSRAESEPRGWDVSGGAFLPETAGYTLVSSRGGAYGPFDSTVQGAPPSSIIVTSEQQAMLSPNSKTASSAVSAQAENTDANAGASANFVNADGAESSVNLTKAGQSLTADPGLSHQVAVGTANARVEGNGGRMTSGATAGGAGGGIAAVSARGDQKFPGVGSTPRVMENSATLMTSTATAPSSAASGTVDVDADAASGDVTAAYSAAVQQGATNRNGSAQASGATQAFLDRSDFRATFALLSGSSNAGCTQSSGESAGEAKVEASEQSHTVRADVYGNAKGASTANYSATVKNLDPDSGIGASGSVNAISKSQPGANGVLAKGEVVAEVGPTSSRVATSARAVGIQQNPSTVTSGGLASSVISRAPDNFGEVEFSVPQLDIRLASFQNGSSASGWITIGQQPGGDDGTVQYQQLAFYSVSTSTDVNGIVVNSVSGWDVTNFVRTDGESLSLIRHSFRVTPAAGLPTKFLVTLSASLSVVAPAGQITEASATIKGPTA